MIRRIVVLGSVTIPLLFPTSALFAADNGPPPAAFVVAFIALFLIGAVVFFVIRGIVAYLLYMCLNRIPAEHRQLEPWKTFLLMIPCFNWIWNFFVYPAIAKSYQSYFQSTGRADVGDCGAQLALWYCIVAACSLVPGFGAIGFLAGVILLVIFLVKAFQLRAMIPESPAPLHGKF